MDTKKKQSLIQTLAVAKSFDENLAEASRIWFVESLINSFESAGNSDAHIEQKTKDLVAATKALVVAERDFALALTADGNKRYTPKLLKNMRRHRVEILYGAIAREPQLAVAAQRDYLRFLAKRRFRSICRMFVWVNPNKQGYFRYRKTCKVASYWRLNEDATPAWWELASLPARVPIKLTAAGGAIVARGRGERGRRLRKGSWTSYALIARTRPGDKCRGGE